jgi:hypothetical protein
MDRQSAKRKDPWRPIIMGTVLFVVITLLLAILALALFATSLPHGHGERNRTITAVYATNSAVFQAISATETSQTATAVQQIADATEMARIKAIPLPRFPIPR